MKKVPLIWHDLRWPREVDAETLAEVIRLLATVAGSPMILEATGQSGSVTHRIAVPDGRHQNVAYQLRAALPGVSIDSIPSRQPAPVDRAIELRLSTKHRPLRTDNVAAVSRSVLGAMADLHDGESLCMLWLLGPTLRPIAVPNHIEQLTGNTWWKDVALTAIGKQVAVDADTRNALKAKQALPGWKVAGRIGVTAIGASRQRQLIRQVLAALRSTEAPGVAFWVRSRQPSIVAEAKVPWRFPMRLNALEVAGLAAWPATATADLPVVRQRSRLLPPARDIATSGRVVGRATFPGQERPLAISSTDSLRHVWVIGPSGVGKSTLLSRLIADDMAAGRAVVVIEPKSDLIAECLAHVPDDRIGDVVLIDPRDATGTVGLNPFVGANRQGARTGRRSPPGRLQGPLRGELRTAHDRYCQCRPPHPGSRSQRLVGSATPHPHRRQLPTPLYGLRGRPDCPWTLLGGLRELVGRREKRGHLAPLEQDEAISAPTTAASGTRTVRAPL